MARQTNKSPMPMRGLLALEYLVDNDAMVVTANGGRRASRYGFLKRPTREVPRGKLPDGAPELDSAIYESMRVRGCLSYPNMEDVEAAAGLNKRLQFVGGKPDPEQREPVTPFSWYDHLSEVNDAGREVLEAGRARIAESRRELAGKRDEFVVVGRRKRPGAGAFCRVVNRTEKRVYVEVKDRLGHAYSASVIEGSPGKEYVALEDVLTGEADASTWRRLKRATMDYDEAMARSDVALREKLAPIHSEHEGRVKQLAAAFEDEVKDALNQAPLPR